MLEQATALSRPERVLRARDIYMESPLSVVFDDDGMPWMFDSSSALWLCIDGSYSRYSPEQKRQYALDAEKRAQDREDEIDLWSRIRQKVLARDNYTCQLCGASAGTKLHVHHILKRVEGGTHHYDNLITVCPSCHSKADRGSYNPAWVETEGCAN